MKNLVIKTATASLIFFLSFVSNSIAAETLPVFVSIQPQKYFVEKIAGDFAKVSVMVEPGASPATYEPKPKQMVGLSKARIYFAIGVPFEKVWLKKIASANPDMTIILTQDGIEKIPMKRHYHKKDHSKNQEHHDGIRDPHLWLSPPLVTVLARNILSALTDADPGNRSVYEANCKKFITEIAELDAELREIFSQKGKRFMVFHPAWGYFAKAYNLEQFPVEIEGKNPKPSELRNLIKHASEHGIKVIFVQPQFSVTSAKVIAKAIDGRIAFADPLAPDWADNLRRVAAKFKEALK
ncbi:MAG: zinc ABC transporter solute-binding protein [Desulfobacteraceae bacterium]|nr:zinc ABC transporter solute-binding protein [Desulfobacteraceae bacterium]